MCVAETLPPTMRGGVGMWPESPVSRQGDSAAGLAASAAVGLEVGRHDGVDE